LTINQNKFFSAHLFNSTNCRSQLIIENYFQILSNCTIIPLIKPPKGQYLFNVELIQRINYQDTFLLELKEEPTITFKQSKSIIIAPIILGILFVIGTIIATIIIIKQKRYKFNDSYQNKQVGSISHIRCIHNLFFSESIIIISR
jgi:hypothetical protein